MKCFVILMIVFLFHQKLFSQQDYSGVYGEKSTLSKELREVYKELNLGEEDFGYDAKLILKKVNGNKYKFWLYVCKGFPSYNSGQIDGFIHFKKDSSKLLFTDSVWGGCSLLFVYKRNSFIVEHDYVFGGCGFGANVTAQGVYPLKRKQVKTEDIEKVFQYEVEEATITTAKAYIYKNQTDINPSMQYFVKGDRILLLKDESDRFYTEFISTSGKFVYGWVNKTHLKN